MSVTPIRTPDQFFPVYNRNYLKLVDSRCVNPDFKYIVRLYVKHTTAATYTSVGTFVVLPLADGSLEFDAHPILNNYVTNTYNYLFTGYRYTTSLFQWKAEIFTQDSLDNKEYFIRTYDYNYSFDAAVTLSEESIFSSTIWPRIKPSTTTTINRSISNIPTTLKLRYTDYYSADFFINDVNSTFVTSMIIVTTDVNGVRRKYSHSISSASDLVGNAVASIGIGPMNVSSISWVPVDPVGQFQPLTYDITSYTITLFTNTGASCTCDYTVELECNSRTYTNVLSFDRTWLIYKSRLGGWSYLLFNLRKTKSVDVKKTTYDRKLMYNEYNTSRGITTIGNDFSVSYVLNTDWVSSDQQGFFEDLFTSPQCYMLNTYKNGVADVVNPFVPVQIKDRTYNVLNKGNDRLFSYTVEVSEAESYIRQLR